MVMIRLYQYAGLTIGTYFALTYYIAHKDWVRELKYTREEQIEKARQLRQEKKRMREEQLRTNPILREEQERSAEEWKVRVGTIH